METLELTQEWGKTFPQSDRVEHAKITFRNRYGITLAFVNMPILTYIDEIRSAVLLIHGEQAHSRYFSEDAYRKMASGRYAANKELLILPGADHTDLYDNLAVIPFDRMERFLRRAFGE